MMNDIPLMPVRRLHNYVYCPRLFYYQWVEGLFAENADTIIGSSLHHVVDEPDRWKQESIEQMPGKVKSLSLSSEVLGLTGIVDLIQTDQDGLLSIIDYKKGHPAKDDMGQWQVKENDAIQIAAYSLLLQEQDIYPDNAAIYYAGIKKHVQIELTESLYQSCRDYLTQAQNCAKGDKTPPPLCHSSRCYACSAYVFCLPYESQAWADEDFGQAKAHSNLRPPRPPGDLGELLVVQNPQAYIKLKNGEIQVCIESKTISKHPLHQLNSLALYGNIQVSAQAMVALIEHDVSISYFSPAGRFIGMASGMPPSGVKARMGQTLLWHSQEKRLPLIKECIYSKIHNQRVMMMRNGDVEKPIIEQMASLRDSVHQATSIDTVRGIEGMAASLYFASFSSMISERSRMGFDFNGRNKRPPRDPVNAMLSLAYSILSKEIAGLCLGAGLDPFLGFFHSHGYAKPALALDLMEEFRPIIADSVVISLINRGEIAVDDFLHTTKGVALKDSGRRQFWKAWSRRLDTEITHPHFGYKMSYRRMMDVQIRQFHRFCRGETDRFFGFTVR